MFLFQSNPKPASVPTPRAIEIDNAQVALDEEQEGAIADDLIGGGFTCAKIELHRDAVVAEATRPWALRQGPRDRAGTRKLLMLYVWTGAGSAIGRACRVESISTGSG